MKKKIKLALPIKGMVGLGHFGVKTDSLGDGGAVSWGARRPEHGVVLSRRGGGWDGGAWLRRAGGGARGRGS